MNVLNNYLFTFSKNSKIGLKQFHITNTVKYISSSYSDLFPPLMIIIYGLENFGIWVFLTAIPNAFAILNLNLNDAAKTEMSIFIIKNKVN